MLARHSNTVHITAKKMPGETVMGAEIKRYSRQFIRAAYSFDTPRNAL